MGKEKAMTLTPSTAPFSEAEDEGFVCPDCNGCGEVQCVNLGEDYRSDTLPCPTCIAREYASESAALLSAQSGTDVAKAVAFYEAGKKALETVDRMFSAPGKLNERTVAKMVRDTLAITKEPVTPTPLPTSSDEVERICTALLAVSYITSEYDTKMPYLSPETGVEANALIRSLLSELASLRAQVKPPFNRKAYNREYMRGYMRGYRKMMRDRKDTKTRLRSRPTTPSPDEAQRSR